MKVTCQSCQAKYTIADEKVRGKVAKIRCKKCGTTIIVDGNDSAAAGAADSGPVADYTQQGASDEQWTVLVADGDQRTLTPAQVAELYASGTVGLETLVWKDGLADWQAISQTDALRSVVENGPRPAMTPLEVAASIPSSAPPVAAEAPASRPAPAVAARAKTAEPAAARRPGRGGSTDLFGAAHEDVMTSASEGAAAHADGGADKLTGARNENSVLFSLSALTGSGSVAPSPAAAERDPASNKADLRALMGGGGGGGPAKSKIDDIMNLSGGGVYSPGLLAAPAMAPPPIDMMTAAAAPADSGSKGKSLMLAIGGGLLVVGAVAVAFTAMSSKADPTDKAGAATSATAESAPVARVGNAAHAPAEAPAAEQTGAAREPVRQGESAKPEGPSGETAPAAVAPGSPPPKVEGEKVERKVAAAPKAEKPAAPAAPAGLPPPPVAAPAPAPAAPAPAAPAAGGSGDFDRAAALSALSAAATAAQSCKKPDGPTGSGRIAVTFANNGTATTANVEGPPFAGTPVGGCVAARFRGVHIPPFGGSVITVRKTFIIN